MAFFSLIIYTALIYIRPHEIYQEMTGNEPWPILAATAVLTLVFAILTGKFNIRRLFYFPQSKLILGLLGALLLSQFIQFRFRGAWETFGGFWGVVGLYIFIVCLLETPEKIKGYVVLLVLLTTFLAYQGIEQYNTGTSWGGHTALVRNDEVRIRWIGIFDDPNDLAVAFTIIVPFPLFFLASPRPFFQKGVGVGILSSILYAMFLTKSRGGYIGLAAILYLFFAIRYKGMKSALIGGVGLFSLFLLAPARLTSSLSGGQFVDYGRVNAWSTGLRLLKSSPVFGVGQGRFQEFHEIAAHSSYIEILSESGLVGGFFWAALFYVTLRDFYRIKNLKSLGQLEDPHGLMDIGMSLFLGLFGFLCVAFFLSRAYNFLPYVLAAIWVATVDLLHRDNQGLNLNFGKNDFFRVSCLVIGFVLCMQFGVKFLWSSR